MSADLIAQLAHAYKDGNEWRITSDLKEKFARQVEHWYAKIHVPVRWISDTECKQPFNTAAKMAAHTKQRGELLMLSEHSDELGRDLYSKHRAVHDWFGHILPGKPFGGPGESRAFVEHTRHYTPDVWPIVFSDVVLSNNYWQHFGRGWGAEKWVYRPDLIPAVIETYGKDNA
jgi:hypothetical protein